jgi:hypothetical protein
MIELMSPPITMTNLMIEDIPMQISRHVRPNYNQALDWLAVERSGAEDRAAVFAATLAEHPYTVTTR